MKLNFRDIKKKQFSIEAEPSAVVSDVKKQVAEHESAESSQIRLIHSGKVLADDKSIESYGIKESDHIICMVSKPKPPPVSQQPPSTPAQSSTTQTPAAPAPATGSTTASNAPGTPTPAASQTAAERRFDDTSPLMGPERQAAIANMESMGFARPEIERAMRAAFFNPDRAVDFLLNGIPDNVQAELDAAQNRQAQGQQGGGQGGQQPAAGATGSAPAPAAATPAQPAGGDEPVNLFEQAAAANQGGRGAGGAGAGAGGAGAGAGARAAAGGLGGATPGAGGDLSFLRDNPMFQQLRGLVQAQPAMLETVLHQVSAANPQLAQLISQNPQQFLEMLTEGGDGEGVPLPPGARDISVTEEERDAIERLCSLGFERDLVIQAYFACDKNEELAANFLFDNQREEGDEGGAA